MAHARDLSGFQIHGGNMGCHGLLVGHILLATSGMAREEISESARVVVYKQDAV